MKTRNLFFILVVALFFSGCVIWSFYPLYTEKDLFENEILTGNWMDGDSLQWEFVHRESGNPKIIDKKSYELRLTDYDSAHTSYDVHIVKLNGNYFLDFYLTEISTPGNEIANANKDIAFWQFHIMPVHTFAKLTIINDTLKINWFDKDWLYEEIKGKKTKIKHEYSDNNLLLTAKTADLQKLVIKYADTPEAFKEGMSLTLFKK